VNVVTLFSGVEGLGLGLERAGMTIVGQVEIDPWCRRVLERHWPEVPKHDDVRTAVEWWRSEPRPPVHVVAGGPPCQPFSHAGRGRGVADERWMWPAMAHAVRELRPRYVVVENVASLTADRAAFGWILADLAELGFDAEWSLLPACAVGAPHTRERLFLVAYADVQHGPEGLGAGQARRVTRIPGRSRQGQRGAAAARAWRDRVDWAVAASAASDRDADGLAGRMVEAGGNAVVPAVAERVGRMIMNAERAA
jgi:DNA (cytosine-5)-methyltransferase 1